MADGLLHSTICRNCLIKSSISSHIFSLSFSKHKQNSTVVLENTSKDILVIILPAKGTLSIYYYITGVEIEYIIIHSYKYRSFPAVVFIIPFTKELFV